ncbi:MAG: Cellulosome-anchoring protein, partial [Candidatus Peregrinibacteria bacterium GW2011_GWA2_47_7]
MNKKILAGAITVVFLTAGSFSFSKAATEEKNTSSFIDVSEDHPYADAILFLKEEQIVSGYPDSTFRPDISINRAEFTKIIFEMMSSDPAQGEGCFPDVQKKWYEKYACSTQERGWIQGYPDGTFKGQRPISFAEAATIIAKAFGHQPEPNIVWYKPFTDELEKRNAVPPTISEMGQKITRGEMAEILYRLKKVDEKETTESSNSREKSTQDFWNQRIEAALAPSECPVVAEPQYGAGYYTGRLIDTHFHIPHVPDSAPRDESEGDMENEENNMQPLLGINATISNIVCTLRHEKTEKVFAFFPVFENIDWQLLEVVEKTMEQYPKEFVPFIMAPDNDNDKNGFPTVSADVLSEWLDEHPSLFKGYGESGLYARKGGAPDLPPDSERLLNIYPVVREHNLTVYFHLGEGHQDSFERALSANPDINFIWHGDQLIPYENGIQNLSKIDDILSKHPNAYYGIDELYGDVWLLR